jgi:hypothetical protein
MRWVRPDFTTVLNSPALRSRAAARCSRAGIRSLVSAEVAATWTEVGKTSFEDWEALTWSFGWTVVALPAASRARVARVAMTSLAFMFEEVPEPVW